MDCGVRSVKCKSVECGVWSAKCIECKVFSVKCSVGSVECNPFLLILNVPLILKTGIHLQFPKISVWPI